MLHKNIFEFIKAEEAAYALPIEVINGYEWSMKEHVRLSTLYKNSQFSAGNSEKERDDKPFKNIILPIVNLQYRATGFDVKDITLYVDDEREYFKSFLVKKYHDQWATENEIDTFIDDMVESYVDFGGALIKDINQKKPEVQPLQSIAFADQTNMLAGPIGFTHYYSPDELYGMEKIGWGDPKNHATVTIQEAIVLASPSKTPDTQHGKKNQTTGKYVECKEVHGMLPESWLYADGNPDKFVRQMHIVLFYKDEKGEKQGVTLFAGRQRSSPFKLILRDKIYNRALGRGAVEELFDPQVWVNDSEIAKRGMLEAASKTIYYATDPKFKQQNDTSDLDNGEILTGDQGTTFTQINTSPVNIVAFDNAVAEWTAHAQMVGAANDSILGETPASGTPFKLQELVTMESHGLHEYRKGKLATFTGTMYKDWTLPWIMADIVKGKKFLAELSLDELQQVADAIVACQINDIIKAKILNGEEIYPEEVESVKQKIRDNFMKGGSKRFLEIFKDEMKDVPVVVHVNIAGKQKDLNKMTDKIVNIFRQIIANPAVLDDPRMVKLLNQIIEYSGMSPVDFGFSGAKPPAPAPQLPTPKAPQAQPQLAY